MAGGTATEEGHAGLAGESLTAALGRKYMVPSNEVITTSEAQNKHLRAFEDGCAEWEAYQVAGISEADMQNFEDFVTVLLVEHDFDTQETYEKAIRVVRKSFKVQPSKPQIVRAYYRLREAGRLNRHAIFERIVTKKAVRSNSGVVVITLVTAPGKFSCPHDCHYCPDEPGQPRSYLSTEPAVARANQNDFDPVKQFYDRAGTLAKQGHTVDKVEIIVLGGTWSGYPRDYQEEFCRDIFYAANTFLEGESKLGHRQEEAASTRPRRPLLEEQQLNEKAHVKIIGLTLETRPDHINLAEVRRLRRYGCTRVQIGVQHTNDEVLKQVNRGHERKHAVAAVQLLKTCAFKVDIHIMPDLPGSDPACDQAMFDDILHGEDLQADHWKIYPCEVTPFTQIEKWYNNGTYMPYTEHEPQKLIDLLAKVKSEVHPWIRLNRVIRDIPEVSIIAGNSNTNLRQAVFGKLKTLGKSCRCIRCREVRDWPEPPEKLRVRVREYRSSGGTEFFISVEGGPRGLGGGATQRGLTGGKKPKITKAEKRQKKVAAKLARSGENIAAGCDIGTSAIADQELVGDEDAENATLYGLLRLRLNDDSKASSHAFPELADCALIRELHVYGVLVAARQEEADRIHGEDRPQHGGIGRTLMATAEHLAAGRGWSRIAVIAGVGVRNYYRRLHYEQYGDGQYLIKRLQPSDAKEQVKAQFFEAPFLEAVARLQRLEKSAWRQTLDAHGTRVAMTAVGLAALGAVVLALHRWRRGATRLA